MTDPALEHYVPQYGLIHRYLVDVADTVLAAGRHTVTADTVLRNHELGREMEPSEVEHLLAVLEQAGLVGPPDSAGRRPVLVSGRKAKPVMTAVKAIAHVAGRIGDEPLEAFE